MNIQKISFSLKHGTDHFFNALFFRDIWFLSATALSLLLHMWQWVLLFLNLSLLKGFGEEYIALHTKQYIGVDFYSYWYYIFLAPLTGLIIFFVNTLCARRVRVFDKALYYSFLIISVWVQLGIIMALGHVIKINAF